MNLNPTAVAADYRQDLAERAAIARKTDSAPPRMICAWCPDFDPEDLESAGATHGLCPRCEARLNAELDRVEASRPAPPQAGR